MMSKRTRFGGAGAMLVAAAVGVNIIGAPGGAQSEPPVSIEHPGVDTAPAVSDDGNIVVFRSVDADGVATIQVHNRLAGTTAPLTDSFPADVATPAISGNGCVVAYIAPGVDATGPVDPPVTDPPATDPPVTDPPVTDPPATDPPVTDPPVTDPPVTDPPGTDPQDPDPAVGDQPVPGDPANGDLAVEAATQTDPPAMPPELRVVDRCADLDVPTPLTPIVLSGSTELSRPAVSLDGSVVAVSDGQSIYRFARATSGDYNGLERFDGPNDPTPELFTTNRVAVSDDGSVVAFASGADLGDPRTLSVYTWVDGIVTSAQAGAWAPSLSGDGRVLAYEDVNGVSVMDRLVPGSTPIQLAPGGTNPVISADGHHVAHVNDEELRIISWTGQGLAPFDVTVLSRVGAVLPLDVVVDLDRGGAVLASHDDMDVVLVERNAVGAFSSDSFDLGSGDIGEVLSARITFSNSGPASLVIGEPTVESPFVLSEVTCGSSIRPESTCSFLVSFTVERYEDAFGVVTIPSLALGSQAATTEVRALGEPPVVTTSPTTTAPSSSTSGGGSTTSGTTSTGGSTSSSSTGGSTSSSSTGGRTTSSSSSSSSSTGGRTTTTTVPGAGVTFSPTTFDFAPTIVDAGRRTATIEIVNSSTTAARLDAVRLDPATGPFEIVANSCANSSLAGSSRCTIDLAFAPTSEGDQSVSVIAQISGGAELTATVSGVGAPPPSLRVIPGVATVGQVVTLSGAGFPTGVTVRLDWADGLVERDVVVSDGGTFNVPVVVLPNTPQGPVNASVAGQDDLFGVVTTTMVVTSTSDRSSPAVLDGVGPSVGR